MRRWKVGIAGLSRGRGFVRVFGAHPRIEVAAVCDVDEARLAEVGDAFRLPDRARFASYDKMLGADLDIVMIATPIPLHAEQTIAALEGGRHVLCEQTAAYTVEDCARIVDAVRRTGRTYMMAENYCYFHYIREWKKMLDAGRVGAIFYAEAEYIHEIINLLVDHATGRYYWRHERPPIWYCAHCIGPLLFLMDDRIVQACGSASRAGAQAPGFSRRPDQADHPGFLDMEVGLFRTRKGALIKILRSQVAHRYPHLVWYSLYGTKGYVESGRDMREGLLFIEGEMDTKSGAKRIPCLISDPDAPEEARAGGHGTSEYYMIRDFLDAIEQEKRPPIDVVRAMDFTVPGLIAHESAMGDGNWREVPAFDS